MRDWRVEIRRRDGELLEERWLLRRGSYFDIATDFYRSSLNGHSFELFDWKGIRRAIVDLEKLVAL